MPSLAAMLTNPSTGIITQPWYIFLQQLFSRTGGVAGGDQTVVSGSLIDYCGPTAPDGYLACNGSAVSRTVYASLYEAIGVTWGSGDGSTTFNVPDFRGVFIYGANGSNPVGTLGGSATATLDVGNLPAHNHPVIDPGHLHAITDPGHNHTALVASNTNTIGSGAGSGTAGNTGTSATGITINTATTGVTTNNTGSGDAFAIIPPYATVLKCIKT